MFDVFLCHSSRDKRAVELIAHKLKANAGLEPFLDWWHLVPGERWQPALEKALEASRAAAVFIGSSGVEAWHHEEVQAALAVAVRTRDEYRVIPVLLPGADEKEVTGFLARRTWVDFRQGLEGEEPFQRLVRGIKGIPLPSEVHGLPDEPAPYRGLRRFEKEHAGFFFGREEEIVAVLGKMERSSFVAVVGASGAGKSSLAHAGVLPRLERSVGWPRPLRTWSLTPGADPLRALAGSLVALLPPSDRLRAADELTARIRHHDDGLRTAVGALVGEEPGTTVLVVDQLEEIFTHAAEGGDPGKVRSFAANLLDCARRSDGRLRILATVRADFLGHCLRIADLREVLQDDTVFLGPMSPAGLRDAIVRPASAVGAFFETGLVSALMKELEHQPSILPLLEHTLDRLWRARNGVWLTSAAYEAMGGLTGALKNHAEACLATLGEGERSIARDLFLRLTALGDGVPDTRRRVNREELYAVGSNHERVDHVLQHLSGTGARLLAVDGQTVEVSHEVLIQEWPALRGWIDGARRSLRIHRRLTEAARDWEENGREAGDLLSGARLLEAEEAFGADRRTLNQGESDFLAASTAGRDRQARLEEERHQRELEDARRLTQEAEGRRSAEEAQRRAEAARAAEAERREGEQLAAARRLRRALYGLGIISMAAIVSAGIAASARLQAQGERNLAFSRELTSVALRRLREDPQLAILLIAAAQRVQPTRQVHDALEEYAAEPGLAVLTSHSARVLGAAFSRDGKWVVAVGEDGTARVWDAASGASVAEFHGHVGPVIHATFSPGADRVATCGEDGTARVWDVRTSQALFVLRGHKGAVKRAEFGPDGKWLVTVGEDGTTRVWEASSGTVLAKLGGRDKRVLDATFSPDGRRVATASEDGTAHIWDVASDEFRVELRGHSKGVLNTAFSPDGHQLVTAGEDGTARVWDAASGRSLAILAGHRGPVMTALFSADGRQVVTASKDGTARIWDLASGHTIAELRGHTEGVLSAVFSMDGRRVVTASEDGTARVWDSVGGRALIELRGHTEAVTSAAFSPDGQWVVTASEDGSVRLWNAAIGKPAIELRGHAKGVLSAAFDPGAGRVVTASEDGTARVWDASSGRILAELRGHNGWVTRAVFDSDGRRVVTTGQDGTARVWDTASGRVLVVLSGGAGEVTSVGLSEDGQRVVTAGASGTARVWDAASGQLLVELRGHTEGVTGAAFSPDHRRLVTASMDRTARIWDSGTGERLVELRGHTEGIMGAAFNADGALVVTSSADQTARIWDVGTGKVRVVLRGHAQAVTGAAFSPDGRRVLTRSWDRTVRTWDTVTGRPLAEMRGHTEEVWSAAFSPDGERVVTASTDGTARIWDAVSGALQAELRGHTNTVKSAQFSPDGKSVVTASEDGTARIWADWHWAGIEPAHLERLCARRALTCTEGRVYLHEEVTCK